MPFCLCVFFTCSPKQKTSKWKHFVDIESFRPCLSKPSYRAPKWALMARLMQKERLKSPRKSLIIENQAFWVVILAIFGQNCHFGHFGPCFGQPFPIQGGHAEKKSHLGSCLNQQDRAASCVRFCSNWIPREAGLRILLAGVSERKSERR